MTNNINGIDVSESVLTATNNDVYYSQKAVDELQNVIKRLQEENEKLKADLKGETEQAQKWYQLETDKHFLMMKYRKALEEIRDIAEKLITETPEYHSCYYKDECGDKCTPKQQNKVTYCCYENVEKIENLINEVLNVENN